MDGLRLRYIGPFSAERGGEAIRFPLRAAAGLLAILALDPERERARESLSAHLWPDADAERRAASLRTALS